MKHHGPQFWLIRICVAVSNVPASESRRQQEFDRLADHLISAVRKHGFSLLIDDCNPAFLVDDNHRIRRGFQKISKELFRVGEIGRQVDSPMTNFLVLHRPA